MAVMNLFAQVEPIDLEQLKRIQELDPIERPDGADDYERDNDTSAPMGSISEGYRDLTTDTSLDSTPTRPG